MRLYDVIVRCLFVFLDHVLGGISVILALIVCTDAARSRSRRVEKPIGWYGLLLLQGVPRFDKEDTIQVFQVCACWSMTQILRSEK